MFPGTLSLPCTACPSPEKPASRRNYLLPLPGQAKGLLSLDSTMGAQETLWGARDQTQTSPMQE